MPHLFLEYTDNLNIDTQATLLRLNEALVGSGHFDENSIKARAIRLDDYVVGTQPQARRAFLHLRLTILSGRTLEVKKEITDLLVATVQKEQEWPDGMQVQITADVSDMQREIYGKLKL
ncbi:MULTISPECIES: 5-carboxymethyl-2-hydroxymuconate Delta-isomerase [unclassified Herbaspirillum]|uniref:5-carboxymethyl-2-hydroxymuconate Delta-isomerase n=1 Tax=unclassified Herbaspirillum TaxID=2624150 RepID=UPI00115241DB|nr:MULTISPECIES: 5-carboxymethyl-2-hydroxymuconate Delta-isomerase [unclassified Herbaspirillum]MBB5392737.1 5-carboxymethyl-2-hydroxymuconate isomerase [Herbaspirillum sp. SJZ102]TQJ99091.1 5-carboxymethyl-2-hydroxymuconate isomerase [Herbaspirillum sp. SJZ130]TQK04104.1 5-carboxymethyl-2-hydroxymuconate isomerase [Herbaspirillum sp. SJZ106]TWC68574.1 5-carboxymethyl-2-hydroxymuconate isomerase [Herbaspirillum sp. SJZ099]